MWLKCQRCGLSGRLDDKLRFDDSFKCRLCGNDCLSTAIKSIELSYNDMNDQCLMVNPLDVAILRAEIEQFWWQIPYWDVETEIGFSWRPA